MSENPEYVRKVHGTWEALHKTQMNWCGYTTEVLFQTVKLKPVPHCALFLHPHSVLFIIVPVYLGFCKFWGAIVCLPENSVRASEP